MSDVSATCPRLGFRFRVVLAPDTAPPDVIRLRASFAAWTASRGLVFQLRGSMRHWAHAVWREGSQAEHADVEAAKAWSAAQPEVQSVDAGPIGDLDED